MNQNKRSFVLKNLITLLLFTTFMYADDTKKTVEENLLVLGVQLSYGTSTETISNQTGSRDFDRSLIGVKVLVGQDFDFYRVGQQTSRLQLGYKYSALESDVSFSTVSIGYRENMLYWKFFGEGERTIYPLASLDLGYAAIDNGLLNSKGLSVELDVGVAYRYKNIDVTLALASTYIDWNYPEEGITDYMNNYEVALGLSYRFMN